jgi:hypothetical protein
MARLLAPENLRGAGRETWNENLKPKLGAH